jgi:hypothetical protein
VASGSLLKNKSGFRPRISLTEKVIRKKRVALPLKIKINSPKKPIK